MTRICSSISSSGVLTLKVNRPASTPVDWLLMEDEEDTDHFDESKDYYTRDC